MEELPSEILCEIFKNLNDLDIFTCGLCCRRFYDIAKYINPFKDIYALRKTIIEYSIKTNDIDLYKNNLINVDVAFRDNYWFPHPIHTEAFDNHVMYYFKFNRVYLFKLFIQSFKHINCFNDNCINYMTNTIIHCIKTNNIQFYIILLNITNDCIDAFRMHYSRFIIQNKNKVMLEFSIGYLKKFKSIKLIMESLILISTPLTLNYSKTKLDTQNIKYMIIEYFGNDYYEQLCRKFKYQKN